MSSVSAIALSGMASATTALGSSAHNVANQQTEGFRRQTVRYSEVEGGGVTTRVDRAALPGHALERDVVDQLSAKNAFLANLAVFRRSDAMTGEVLDLLA
jgi:flagellar basal body rod protein FlgC